MHIPSLKRYITMTYKMFGDKKYSSYWNSGYINALENHKIITAKEARILSKHNIEKELSYEKTLGINYIKKGGKQF